MVDRAQQKVAERAQHLVEVGPRGRRRRRFEQQARGLELVARAALGGDPGFEGLVLAGEQPVALELDALALADVGEQHRDALLARVVALLVPGVEGGVVGLEGADLAELHGAALVALELAAGGVGEQLPKVAAERLFAAGEDGGGLVVQVRHAPVAVERVEPVGDGGQRGGELGLGGYDLLLYALALRDLAVVGADPRLGRVDAHLEPVAACDRAVLEDRRHAELHGCPVVLGERALAQLREHLPGRATQQFVARLAGEAQGGAVDVHGAVLPVEGQKGFVDLFEHGSGAGVAMTGVAGLSADARLECGGRAAGDRPARHVHLETAVDDQAERVHEGGDDVETAAVVDGRVGRGRRVEARHVEGRSPVLDGGRQEAVVEGERDRDVGVGAAVAYSVGAGFLDAEHEVVDHALLGAVLAQVVAQPFAGAQQVRRFRRDVEVEMRRRGVRGHGRRRHRTPCLVCATAGLAPDCRCGSWAGPTASIASARPVVPNGAAAIQWCGETRPRHHAPGHRLARRQDGADGRPVPHLRAPRLVGRAVQGAEHGAELGGHRGRRRDGPRPGLPGRRRRHRGARRHEPRAAQAVDPQRQPGGRHGPAGRRACRSPTTTPIRPRSGRSSPRRWPACGRRTSSSSSRAPAARPRSTCATPTSSTCASRATRGAPVLLVGDIDRGGVFAALLGHMELFTAPERALVGGFVVNKFRGDAGPAQPRPRAPRGAHRHAYARRRALARGLARRRGGLGGPRRAPPAPRPRGPCASRWCACRSSSNTTDFDALAAEPDVAVELRRRPRRPLAARPPSCCPAPRATVADLAWLRERGIDRALRAAAATGVPVIGICGGYQMLGRRIIDPGAVESAAAADGGARPARRRDDLRRARSAPSGRAA